ncbi:MAG: hypothetical protein GYA23_11985 [Methanomicrobiales archaeon]|nr:hypothetical protein [Methanomicrobiales archaeon]
MALSLTDPEVLTGIAGGLIVVILAALAFLLLKKRRQSAQVREKTAGERSDRLAYQPAARPIPVVRTPTATPRPAPKPAANVLPKPKDISILNGRDDITGSLHALVEKYSLEQFTIATSDGLVFASSGAESAQQDAAKYGEIFVNDPLSETPGVVLSGVSYKGSDLILIIRTPCEIPEEITKNIENDTKDILNWWI